MLSSLLPSFFVLTCMEWTYAASLVSLMTQIEHFVDPKDKKHPKFASIADKELVLFGRVRGNFERRRSHGSEITTC